MNLQKMTSKIDMDVLAEIIAGLEGKMTEPGEGRPFKKKAVAVMDIDPSESEVSEELSASDGEESEEGEQSMEELLELYNKLKG